MNTKEQVVATANTSKEVKRTKEFLKCEFTHDELHAKGMELARLNAEKIGIENEKKAVTSQFKAKIDGKDAEIEVISNHINTGFEHRYVQVDVAFNTPNTGYKTLTRIDTGEVYRKDSMSAEEMQLKFDLDADK